MPEYESNDGRFECTSCEWWVPAGMEYLRHDHDCE